MYVSVCVTRMRQAPYLQWCSSEGVAISPLRGHPLNSKLLII